MSDLEFVERKIFQKVVKTSKDLAEDVRPLYERIQKLAYSACGVIPLEVKVRLITGIIFCCLHTTRT